MSAFEHRLFKNVVDEDSEKLIYRHCEEEFLRDVEIDS